MKLKSPYLIKPHAKVRLADMPTDELGGFSDKDEMDAAMEKNAKRLDELQEVLYASQSKALLIVLQGMDTAGKDGAIRHIFSGINPQGCQVASFKVPTQLESRHDFLWRCHEQVPPRGMIGIFNRSHYEDVLVARVHNLVPKSEWHQRYAQINDFERMLSENHTRIIKFMLYISKEEQARRFQARLDDKTKGWKFSPADLKEREYWDQYIAAYDEALRRCSTEDAPWYVIPSNKKWFRNLAVSEIVLDTLDGMKLKYPKPAEDLSQIRFE